jgi:hypothetical protein
LIESSSLASIDIVVCADPAAERRDYIIVGAFIGFYGELLALADRALQSLR